MGNVHTASESSFYVIIFNKTAKIIAVIVGRYKNFISISKCYIDQPGDRAVTTRWSFKREIEGSNLGLSNRSQFYHRLVTAATFR